MIANPAMARSQLPQGLSVFRRALRWVGAVELTIAVVAFSSAVALNIIQISLRYAFDTSIWWAQEVSLLMIMVAYYIGISCVFRMRHYVIIHFLVERFSLRTQLYLYYFAQLLTIVFCSVVLFESIGVTEELLTTYTVIMHLPIFYWTLPLMVASASIIVTSIYYFWAMWNVATRIPGATIASLEAEVFVDKDPHER
jgi:TRAP-type C4-dicarboxylate transport system permease small subunit